MLNNQPGSATPKHDFPTTVKPIPPSPPPPPPPPPPSETKRQRSISPAMGKTKADAWEEAELAKIKERYSFSDGFSYYISNINQELPNNFLLI